MKRCTLLMILGALLLSSCSSAPIPQRKLMSIYYEMFTTDQLVTETPGYRAQADSLSVYGGILERHGYTVEDYLAAVDFYLRKPEAFARMMKKVQTRINREITQMEAEEERMRAERESALAESDSTEVSAEMPDDGTPVDSLPLTKRPKKAVQWD